MGIFPPDSSSLFTYIEQLLTAAKAEGVKETYNKAFLEGQASSLKQYRDLRREYIRLNISTPHGEWVNGERELLVSLQDTVSAELLKIGVKKEEKTVQQIVDDNYGKLERLRSGDGEKVK